MTKQGQGWGSPTHKPYKALEIICSGTAMAIGVLNVGPNITEK